MADEGAHEQCPSAFEGRQPPSERQDVLVTPDDRMSEGWCYRMWQQGWEVHVVPDAVMEHRLTRLSSRSVDFRSAATRHHWASLLKLFVGRAGPPSGRWGHRTLAATHDSD